FFQSQIFRNRDPGVASEYHFPFMSEVQRWNFNIFSLNVIPNVHFCPVTNRESPEMLPFEMFSVQEIPQLRTLVLWIPLTKIIPMGEESFFCPGFLFIPSASPDRTIYFIFFNSIQEGGYL